MSNKTNKTSDLREAFNCRLAPLTRRLLEAEANARGTGVGQLLDDIALAYCRSAEAIAIVREHARHHPLVIAMSEIEHARNRAGLALNEKDKK